ncbi:MAG TPA: hypothetical protein VGP37_09145, partial [Candidatus Nanopelagicales bacterium]|nr:hypothetical protein [Candidatus Nanopelagicales bacterium]
DFAAGFGHDPPMNTETAVSARPAALLMWLTYLVGGIGYFIGIATLQQEPASLSVAALMAVTATGVLSFIRHAIFNRSDAAHGGWDYGQRNNFQIEVGLANLAWGAFALLAVVLDWGLIAVSSSFLISGLYFVFVAVFVIVTPGARQRGFGGIIGISVWGTMMIVMGAFGMSAALGS